MVLIQTRQRATRFPIETSLLFRERGQCEWRVASTLNLSHSGMLFRTQGPLPLVGCAVEFVLMLPVNGLAPTPEIRGIGKVVRLTAEPLPAAAMTIESHAFDCRPPS